MFSDNSQCALFGGVGIAIVSFILYLVKRRVERKRHSESINLDQRQLELIDCYLTNKQKWESDGQYIEVPASIAGKITHSLTPQQWEECYATLAAHHIRSVHSTCMWFESIAATYPEYEFALVAHRNEFLRWYNANVQYLPATFKFMPEQVARVIHAYSHRVTNPTEANVAGFYSALTDLTSAMDSGEIKVSHDN